MSNKFTEEQYKKLVFLQKEYFYNNVLYPDKDFKSLVGTIRIDEKSLYNFIVYYGLENQTVALMNPLTREWAHDQYVEKEKLYVWHSKKINNHGKSIRLFKYTNQSIGSFLANRSDKVTEDEHLTESEIKAWGYKPEMFDKEEVY